MDLKLSSRQEGPVYVMSVGGEIDVYTAPTLRQALLDLVSSGQNRVVLDLSEVGFLDSTGLGVLVGALKRFRENDGELILAGLNDRMAKLFKLTGLVNIFTIKATVEEALAS